MGQQAMIGRIIIEEAGQRYAMISDGLKRRYTQCIQIQMGTITIIPIPSGVPGCMEYWGNCKGDFESSNRERRRQDSEPMPLQLRPKRVDCFFRPDVFCLPKMRHHPHVYLRQLAPHERIVSVVRHKEERVDFCFSNGRIMIK